LGSEDSDSLSEGESLKPAIAHNKVPPAVKKELNLAHSLIQKASVLPQESTTKPKNQDLIMKCECVLTNLKQHPSYSEEFMHSTKMLIDGMPRHDLSAVENKVKNGVYSSFSDFVKDVNEVWEEFMNVNAAGTNECTNAIQISSYFKALTSESADPKKNIMDKPMSVHEKQKLKEKIIRLPMEKLMGVLNIVRDMPGTSKDDSKVEFDIGILPIRICRQLEQYVKQSTHPQNSVLFISLNLIGNS